MARYKGQRGEEGFKAKSYKAITKSEISKLTDTEIRAAIKSAAKTANSRLRRAKGESTASGSYVSKSGYYYTGAKGKNREDLEKQLTQIRDYLAKGETRTELGISNYREKTYKTLGQKDIARKSESDLKAQIKQEGEAANRRLKALQNAGLEDSAVINDKFRNLSDKPFGTDKSLFNLNTQGMSKAELQLQLLNIHLFLSSGYTVRGVKKELRQFKENVAAADMREANYILDAFRRMQNNGYHRVFIYEQVDYIKELRNEGVTASDAARIVGENYDEWQKQQQSYKRAYQRKHRRSRFKH